MKSKSSFGLINPVFNKQSTLNEDKTTDLVMDELRASHLASLNDELNDIDINTIFSSNVDKEKSSSKKSSSAASKKANSKKKLPESTISGISGPGEVLKKPHYDPTTKETFKDTVNLIEPSTTNDN